MRLGLSVESLVKVGVMRWVKVGYQVSNLKLGFGLRFRSRSSEDQSRLWRLHLNLKLGRGLGVRVKTSILDRF